MQVHCSLFSCCFHLFYLFPLCFNQWFWENEKRKHDEEESEDEESEDAKEDNEKEIICPAQEDEDEKRAEDANRASGLF